MFSCNLDFFFMFFYRLYTVVSDIVIIQVSTVYSRGEKNLKEHLGFKNAYNFIILPFSQFVLLISTT